MGGKNVKLFWFLILVCALVWALGASRALASSIPWYWYEAGTSPSSLGAGFSTSTHLSANLKNGTTLYSINNSDIADTIYYPPNQTDISAHNPPAYSEVNMNYSNDLKNWQGSVSAIAGEDTGEYTFFGYHFFVSGNDNLDEGDYAHWNGYQDNSGFFKVTAPCTLRIVYGYSVNGTDSGDYSNRAQFTFTYYLYRYNPSSDLAPNAGYDYEEIASKAETYYVNAVNSPQQEEWVVEIPLEGGYWYKLNSIQVSGYGEAFKGDTLEGDVYIKLSLVPLPGTFWLFGGGLVGGLILRRKIKKNA